MSAFNFGTYPNKAKAQKKPGIAGTSPAGAQTATGPTLPDFGREARQEKLAVGAPAANPLMPGQMQLTNPVTDPTMQPTGARKGIKVKTYGGGPQKSGRGDAAASGGGATSEASPVDFQQQANDLWSGMLAEHDANLGGKMQQTYADQSLAGRRAAEMNAGRGNSVGGSFGQGQAQVAIGGMQARQDTLTKHTNQGLTMKAAYLDKLIKQAEAKNDREREAYLQAEQDKTQLAIANAGLDETQYPDPNEGGGGGSTIVNPDNPDQSVNVSGTQKFGYDLQKKLGLI